MKIKYVSSQSVFNSREMIVCMIYSPVIFLCSTHKWQAKPFIPRWFLHSLTYNNKYILLQLLIRYVFPYDYSLYIDDSCYIHYMYMTIFTYSYFPFTSITYSQGIFRRGKAFYLIMSGEAAVLTSKSEELKASTRAVLRRATGEPVAKKSHILWKNCVLMEFNGF